MSAQGVKHVKSLERYRIYASEEVTKLEETEIRQIHSLLSLTIFFKIRYTKVDQKVKRKCKKCIGKILQFNLFNRTLKIIIPPPRGGGEVWDQYTISDVLAILLTPLGRPKIFQGSLVIFTGKSNDFYKKIKQFLRDNLTIFSGTFSDFCKKI